MIRAVAKRLLPTLAARKRWRWFARTQSVITNGLTWTIPHGELPSAVSDRSPQLTTAEWYIGFHQMPPGRFQIYALPNS